MFSIICIGDSITYGRGEIPSKGWVGRLKEEFEDEMIHKGVYNLGIPGETTHSLKKRIKQEIEPRVWRRKESDYYVAIIQIGGNDAKEIISPGNTTTKYQKFEENLQKCIDGIKDTVDSIILLGLGNIDETRTSPFEHNVFFSNQTLKQYNEIIKTVAYNNNVDFCDLQYFCVEKNQQKELLADGIHPNSQGYDKLYSLIKQCLIEKKILDE